MNFKVIYNYSLCLYLRRESNGEQLCLSKRLDLYKRLILIEYYGLYFISDLFSFNCFNFSDIAIFSSKKELLKVADMFYNHVLVIKN